MDKEVNQVTQRLQNLRQLVYQTLIKLETQEIGKL